MSENDSRPHDPVTAVEPQGRQESATIAAAPRTLAFRLLTISGRALLAAVVLSCAVVLGLRWVPPPTSAFMLTRQSEHIFRTERRAALRYQWVAWDAIAPHMLLAAVAAEDQKFPFHGGFDADSIRKAVEQRRAGGRLRGASTITQQVAKNLFLWSGRSYVRKGLEAYLTLLLECLWPKKRILEVYVNIAEFGDGIYGVSAAAETFLGKHPAELTKREAALLAAALPNPRQREVGNPSDAMRERGRWIEKQMEQLGGVAYLDNL